MSGWRCCRQCSTPLLLNTTCDYLLRSRLYYYLTHRILYNLRVIKSAMTTLCKRPPLPQKRKKLVMKAHAEPKPSEISQQYLEIADEKIRWKTEQNIPSIAPSSIYNHMLSKP